MAVLDIIMRMRQEMEEELVSNILPFWINRMTDEVNGGFYGRITGREEVKPEAEKGAILNARILWTFSAAYRLLKRPEYLETATRAKRTLIDRFYDNEFWWSFTGLSTIKAIRSIPRSRFMLWGSPSTG